MSRFPFRISPQLSKLGGIRAKQILAPLLALTVLTYFVYHIFQGDRGILSWLRFRQTIEAEEKVLFDLQSQKETLERQVYLLKPESIDQDMLEERVRLILNFAYEDEVVIHDGKKG